MTVGEAAAGPIGGTATDPVTTHALTAWLADPRPAEFPYRDVVTAFRRVGKHFVPPDVLTALAAARTALAPRAAPAGHPALAADHPDDPERRRLLTFLAVALDKHDGGYDYSSYIGLDLLALPTSSNASPDASSNTTPLARFDTILVALLSDAVHRELASAYGHPQPYVRQPPDPATVTKRLRLGVRALAPAAARLGVDLDREPYPAARALRDWVTGTLSPDDRERLWLSLLPVHTLHDEYLFIRVLQAFETTFAAMASCLREAIAAIGDAKWHDATRLIETAESLLSESGAVFSLLATMRVEAFREFRDYTEGASAIQSRNYKILESLCRTPDEDRLRSAAYRWVPDLAERARDGQPTLDTALIAARATAAVGGDPATGLEPVATAMARFAGSLRRWRQTHYRLAVRMLGKRPGTGYTEGTPYLDRVRTIPVFRSVGGETP